MEKRITCRKVEGSARTPTPDQYAYKAYVNDRVVATVDVLPSGKRLMWVTDESPWDEFGYDALHAIAERIGRGDYNPLYSGYDYRKRGIPKKKGAYLKVSRA